VAKAAVTAALALALCACGAKTEKPSTPYAARVVAPTGDGNYALREVAFATLTDLDGMTGEVASVRVHGKLDLGSDVDEIVHSDDPDGIYLDLGGAPRLAYDVEDGVVVPLDYQSLEILSLYHVFETVYTFWRDEGGIAATDLGTPRLFYDPRLAIAGEGMSLEIIAKLNAAFLPGPRDFWWFRTSRLEEIPLKLNLGVVAHEFGHLLFDLDFAAQQVTAYDDANAFNTDVLNGINEGLADFYSFVVTKNDDEYVASSELLAEERNLPVPWTRSTLYEADCQGSFYCEGSILASALYEIATQGDRSALEVASVVRAALPSFREDWDGLKETYDFGYEQLVNRILDGAGDDRLAWCEIFLRWFDTPYNRERIRCTN
jgi:hypothetical protein